MYAGCGYAENTKNPGNDGPSPITSTLPGTLAVCAAATACVNFGWNQAIANPGGMYESVDLQFHNSTNNWWCVQYWDPNPTGGSYWNVPNADIVQAYGFSFNGPP